MKPIINSILALALCVPASAAAEPADSLRTVVAKKISAWDRLHVGGYGEAVFVENFFSDNYLRYTDPGKYSDDRHGRFDVPHVVIYLGYDFGKGWSMSSEIEFEHGGVETAMELETEEGGEYEKEIERGGEVALEQFWLQKEFMPQLKIRAGLQVVPIGGTNAHHEPNTFFGVYRPVGESTILPCTWREVSLTVLGRAGDWAYQAMLMPGLDSERFGNSTWISGGSASPFEFKIANTVAGAVRVDNYTVPGLRLSVSGYVGNSFGNTLEPTSSLKNKGVHGTVSIGSFDFAYNAHNVVARGFFDWGHLSDSRHITEFNMSMPKGSSSKKQEVASDACCAGIEAGYDIFGAIPSMRASGQRFYVFGRYDYYNSMQKTDGVTALAWCKRHQVGGGINYYPIRDIVVKAEYVYGILDRRYNNEPSLKIGIAYCGWFK